MTNLLVCKKTVVCGVNSEVSVKSLLYRIYWI